AAGAGCHVEVTNLVIPGLNDDAGRIEELAEWVASHLGEATPLHLSAYHPQYRMTTEGTPVDTLVTALGICRRSLLHVYLGNVHTQEGQDTLCPQCGAVLVRRRGYRTELVGVAAGACRGCGRPTGLVL
ncbi:AmmeMemoRadiSam system radical SAM enzyme, partial [Verrucomicrobiota bacterium]